MRIVKSIRAMQALAQRWQTAGTRIAIVPTMGGLHDGHLSLLRRARRAAGRAGRVVASVFVNPTQFGPGEDFAKYPRDLQRDSALCRATGADVLFAPVAGQMLPLGPGASFSTWISEETLSLSMEGRSRPGHFRGVTTVVAKLFNIVLPDVAVFGAKDWQQAAIVRRMVRDLNFPVNIIVAPTRREPDGLAMSSRNQYLAGDLRRQAVVLHQAIAQVRDRVRASPKSIERDVLKRDLRRFVERQPDARVDYVEFFDPLTLVPAARVGRGTHMALAVFVGKTRLLDNGRL